MRKILSIDAGGVRGIIPATILAEVEARTEQPVCNLFDFFAGTSSGGMLVLALNCPDASGYPRPLCSAAEVAGLFHEWGERPFGSKVSKAGQPIGELSSENRIEDMFREYLGIALLSDCILNSAKAVRNLCNDLLMWQAARATTAVPTHFSPLRLSVSDAPF